MSPGTSASASAPVDVSAGVARAHGTGPTSPELAVPISTMRAAVSRGDTRPRSASTRRR